MCSPAPVWSSPSSRPVLGRVIEGVPSTTEAMRTVLYARFESSDQKEDLVGQSENGYGRSQPARAMSRARWSVKSGRA